MRFLLARLDGPMQAWGTHTYEAFRPTNAFPTRSGLLGLVGACLGITRTDFDRREQLASSVVFTVRIDTAAPRPDGRIADKSSVTLADYHTVENARKVDGTANKFPIESRREYLYDAAFTVAIGEREGATVTLDTIAAAMQRPLFTPFLGRASCSLTRPLLEAGPVEAEDALAALLSYAPIGAGGLIYTEDATGTRSQPIRIRDVPQRGHGRQFGTRTVYLQRPQPTSQGAK